MRVHQTIFGFQILVTLLITDFFQHDVFAETSIHAPSLKTEQIYIADSTKSAHGTAMIQDGLIIGGDRAINTVVVRNIRYSSNSEFERVVIDIEGTRNGEPVAIQRPPYFQVDVSSAQRRIGLSIWGQPKLAFDAKKVTSMFERHAGIQGIVLLPKIENEVWTFEIPFKSDSSIEVFELTEPVRIIMDIKKRKT